MLAEKHFLRNKIIGTKIGPQKWPPTAPKTKSKTSNKMTFKAPKTD